MSASRWRARLGLIPAHAGKTPSLPSRPSPHRAHPRSRGENLFMFMSICPYQGSSPLTRGKPRLRRPGRGTHGLIPAHAGKTWSRCLATCGSGAHPRSRGENSWLPSWVRRFAGSSPLTRGKHTTITSLELREGLIPAHAGKTGFGDPACDGCWAHPRSRGENKLFHGRGPFREGSSPLTRGKRRCGHRTSG